MKSTSQFANMPGNYSGENQLWHEKDIYESKTSAQAKFIGQGQYLSIAYTWEIEDDPQEGLLIFPETINKTPARSIWIDSWHMRNQIMLCDGTKDDHNLISLLGAYPAPSGPDWGWRIEIEPPEGNTLVIRMINISPEGQETLAVLAQYRRINKTP